MPTGENWGRNEFEKRLSHDGELFLKELCAEGHAEHLELEFKADCAKGDRTFDSKGRLTREGRKRLGKAIGAMANTAGGLIIVGVDCRKNNDDVDCAVGLVPISNVERARTSVAGDAHTLTEYPVRGLDVRVIEGANAGEGYLAILVPHSEDRPHRSFDGQYYQRTTDNSVVMPHSIMLDMANRVSIPAIDLDLHFQFDSRQTSGPAGRRVHTCNILANFYATNTGTASAKHLCLSMSYFPTDNNPSLNLFDPFPDIVNLPIGTHIERKGPPNVSLFYDNSVVIHKGQERLLGSLVAELRMSQAGISMSIKAPRGMTGSMGLICTLTAESANQVHKSWEITAEQLWQAIGAPPLDLLT